MCVDLFEIENARNLTIDQLVKTFVPTDTFWSLFSRKNHVVLGSRGSGKTAIGKMISHGHLSRFENDQAKKIVTDRTYIGIYVPMSTEWIGGLKSYSWVSEEEQNMLFQYKLNIKVCLAFLDTLESCLLQYCDDVRDRLINELDIVNKLAKTWAFRQNNIKSIYELRKYIKRVEFEKRLIIAKSRVKNKLDYSSDIGVEYETDLFALLNDGIDVVSDYFNFPDEASWLLCLDEAEILTVEQQKIINSYLRSFSKKLFFKIITMPYHHHIRDTNLGAPLILGNDFEYRYIDYESPFFFNEQSEKIPNPISELFQKRIDASGDKYKSFTIEALLGKSRLLEKSHWDIADDSNDMQLFDKYANEKTKERGRKLLKGKSEEQFYNQIGRKMKGMLQLKEALSSTVGRMKLDVYSGAKMVVRCCDANPRVMIRLFKQLLNEVPDVDVRKRKMPIISEKKQTQVMIKFSQSYIRRIQSEEKIGPELYAFINKIGKYMHHKSYDGKLNTEQISSIKIGGGIGDDIWRLIEKAVENGLLYPNIKPDDAELLPYKMGYFRMAYVLAPHFKLLPRKGVSRSVDTMIGKAKSLSVKDIEKKQVTLF